MANRTARIELRADADRDRRIRQAAQLTHTSVSAFVLDAATERADRVIAEATTSVVPAEWFDALWAALGEPPVANPALRARAARRRRIAQQ